MLNLNLNLKFEEISFRLLNTSKVFMIKKKSFNFSSLKNVFLHNDVFNIMLRTPLENFKLSVFVINLKLHSELFD